jgi:hypothetical protein
MSEGFAFLFCHIVIIFFRKLRVDLVNHCLVLCCVVCIDISFGSSWLFSM